MAGFGELFGVWSCVGSNSANASNSLPRRRLNATPLGRPLYPTAPPARIRDDTTAGGDEGQWNHCPSPHPTHAMTTPPPPSCLHKQDDYTNMRSRRDVRYGPPTLGGGFILSPPLPLSPFPSPFLPTPAPPFPT
ncbi:hypothetical protein BOTBODRAFT_175705 [Botryobasidium botryosum FD-172 SS1]|uniref:Uncharacterized protein n=1 Tax=Botryobasidium botryosum (strain FD-172 SS1) TaxID=930990 RepID=A0A067MNG7_BOTB1|nr:hypothetical protein BOTBODRAFT_175705 [Botryobasidium botryosum FD-172 SS1]